LVDLWVKVYLQVVLILESQAATCAVVLDLLVVNLVPPCANLLRFGCGTPAAWFAGYFRCLR
jgi:hypothetical protein